LIEVLVPKDRFEEYLNAVKQVEDEFNIQFEHEFYKSIYYLSVNDYIAITESGVKQKGMFVTEPDFGDSVDFLIIPKALKAYFVDGIKPEEFIKNHIHSDKLAIYDYCMAPKVDKSYQVYWGGNKQQRLNIVYPSKNAKTGYLFKYRDGTHNHMLKDTPVQLFNNYVDGPYDINYQYFIGKVNETIDIFEPKQLSLF
jgi:hypothetical protein